MFENPKEVEAIEIERIRQTPVDYERNLEIFESMLQYARAMGAMPAKDPLYGIESKIKLAKALNEVTSDTDVMANWDSLRPLK